MNEMLAEFLRSVNRGWVRSYFYPAELIPPYGRLFQGVYTHVIPENLRGLRIDDFTDEGLLKICDMLLSINNLKSFVIISPRIHGIDAHIAVANYLAEAVIRGLISREEAVNAIS